MKRLALLFVLAAAACTSKTDGPTPQIASIVPDPVCDAQQMITLTINGSGFSPIVAGALTSSPNVVLPAISFVPTSGTAIEVPAEDISMPDATGTKLVAMLPVALVPPGTYAVTVTNPDGHSASLDGYVVDPPPDITGITPMQAVTGSTVTVTLTGTGFRPQMTVTLAATPAVMGTGISVSADGTSAMATFDLTGVAAGVYDVVVDNGDGCTATLVKGFTVVSEELTISGIDPPFGCQCTDTPVTISSAGGFASTPKVEMRPAGQAGPVTLMKRVAFVDANTITAVVPSGMALGNYDVTVIDPPSDGRFGKLANAFRVVSMPVPAIEQVVPARGSPQANTAVSIYGNNFRNPVKVELISRAGTVVGTVASVAPVSVTRIDTTLPTMNVAEDAYLVRVTDLDEMTYSTWSAFIVGSEGASGNLHAFTASSALVTGRRMLGGVSARDDVGNTFIYALGGDTGAGGTQLKSVEVAQLSKFGALGTWHQEKTSNDLTVTRDAPVAVAVPLFGSDPFIPTKTYIYVSGGMSGTTVLGSVERAMVLRNADAPKITSAAGSTTAGSLAAGTWYYKVSAILDPNDPDNPGGETLASDEEVVTIDATTPSIALAWSPVTTNSLPAVSYNVYRTKVVDGVSQQETLIANVPGTSYTDSGAMAGTEQPLPPGALGVWRVQTAAHAARWGHQGTVITDGAGNRFLYVLGGKSDATTGYLASVEAAPIDAQGHLGAFGAGTGTVTALPTAIAFFSLVVETAQNVSGFTGAARLFTIGGVTAAGASTEVAQSDITNGGGNGAWAAYAGAGSLGARAGVMAVIASDKLFALGGAAMATATAFTNIRANGDDVAFTANGSIGTPIQSTANAFPGGSPRALGAAVGGSGFIYFVGGTSTGTDAVSTVFQTF